MECYLVKKSVQNSPGAGTLPRSLFEMRVEVIEEVGNHYGIIVGASAHNGTKAAQIVGIEAMVGTIYRYEGGMGIRFHGFFRIGNFHYHIVGTVKNQHILAKSADIGIHIVVAHRLTECLAIAHAAKAAETTATAATELVHHCHQIGDVESRIKEHQSTHREGAIFGGESRH